MEQLLREHLAHHDGYEQARRRQIAVMVGQDWFLEPPASAPGGVGSSMSTDDSPVFCQQDYSRIRLSAWLYDALFEYFHRGADINCEVAINSFNE